MLIMYTKSIFEKEINKFLKLKSKSTQIVYKASFNDFLTFYRQQYGEKTNIGHFLDRIFENMKKPPREQKRLAESEIMDFINYLINKTKSNNTIRAYFGSMQNFLKYKGIAISSCFIGNLPPATTQKKNGKHKCTIEHLKEFVSKAPTIRDKTLIICMLQSGLAVNEICELNYGDIADEYEGGIMPICIELVRKKTGVPFKTFFGRDTLKYLWLYLQSRTNLKHDSPLFTKLGTADRITTSAIQQRFGEIAPKLSFLSKYSIENGFNLVRPHSLRSAFKSRLTGKVDRDVIEFFMGFKLAGVGDSYFNLSLQISCFNVLVLILVFY
jgi:integrase